MYGGYGPNGPQYGAPMGLGEQNKSTMHKFKETFWTTRQALIRKLGKDDDDGVAASDAELDAKLENFRAIQKSCVDLQCCLDRYQAKVISVSQEENGLGLFLKGGSSVDKTRAGKMMTATGKSLCFSAQQRVALKQPLVRLCQEVETFRYRAVADTLLTINKMEAARTEYRGALNWMKAVSEQLDPDAYKQMQKFRTVQEQVRKVKQRFDKLKLDAMQKIDLLSASRCNMFSHVLAGYQQALLAFWAKSARTMSAVEDSFKGYQYYEFSMLKELTEASRKLADDTAGGSEQQTDGDPDPADAIEKTLDELCATLTPLTTLQEIDRNCPAQSAGSLVPAAHSSPRPAASRRVPNAIGDDSLLDLSMPEQASTDAALPSNGSQMLAMSAATDSDTSLCNVPLNGDLPPSASVVQSNSLLIQLDSRDSGAQDGNSAAALLGDSSDLLLRRERDGAGGASSGADELGRLFDQIGGAADDIDAENWDQLFGETFPTAPAANAASLPLSPATLDRDASYDDLFGGLEGARSGGDLVDELFGPATGAGSEVTGGKAAMAATGGLGGGASSMSPPLGASAPGGRWMLPSHLLDQLSAPAAGPPASLAASGPLPLAAAGVADARPVGAPPPAKRQLDHTGVLLDSQHARRGISATGTKDMSQWFHLFADIDPFANPDAIGQRADAQKQTDLIG